MRTGRGRKEGEMGCGEEGRGDLEVCGQWYNYGQPGHEFLVLLQWGGGGDGASMEIGECLTLLSSLSALNPASSLQHLQL